MSGRGLDVGVHLPQPDGARTAGAAIEAQPAGRDSSAAVPTGRTPTACRTGS
jgi:hypothetical protein